MLAPLEASNATYLSNVCHLICRWSGALSHNLNWQLPAAIRFSVRAGGLAKQPDRCYALYMISVQKFSDPSVSVLGGRGLQTGSVRGSAWKPREAGLVAYSRHYVAT